MSWKIGCKWDKNSPRIGGDSHEPVVGNGTILFSSPSFFFVRCDLLGGEVPPPGSSLVDRGIRLEGKIYFVRDDVLFSFKSRTSGNNC